MNQGGYVTLVGFVATEPRIRFLNDGTPVASMRVGSTVRKIDRETGEWRDGETSYFTVKCWRSLAGNTATCLRKGQPVVVSGKLRTSRFEDRTGRMRSEVEVEADTVGFDLKRGVAHFMRNPRPAADATAVAHGEAIRAGLSEEDGAGVADESTGITGEGAGVTGTAGTADKRADESSADPARDEDPDGQAFTAADDDGDEMFDEQAIADLEHELDASAAEPAAI
ncbi:MAG TPA: single-stranded DNA-binding protein [Streptosporangiaceae bacterium]|nr:single-stranded DNA-binding protein [Streptosporangiaceae bacterium]